MSEYANITIGKYDFFSSRNEVRSLLYIFSPEDFKQIIGEEYNEYKYITTVKKAKEILDATGYTLTKLKNFFKEITQSEEFDELFDDELKITKKKYNFDDWLKSIIDISNLLASKGYNYEEPIKRKNSIENLILKTVNYDFIGDDYFWEIPNEYLKLNDDLLIFRAILESFNDDIEVSLDYTWIVEGGYCDINLPKEWFEIERTIILTEGKFDAYVLENIISLLYPHLKKCFYFMDFDMPKIQRQYKFFDTLYKSFYRCKNKK